MCQDCERVQEQALELMSAEFPETLALLHDRGEDAWQKYLHVVYGMPPASLFRIAWAAGVMDAVMDPDLLKRAVCVEGFLRERMHGPH